MEIGCELEVDINGDVTFKVNKKILECFSGRLRKLFGKLADDDKNYLKIIFQEFPGGAEGFELVTRFCYNNGKIEITPSNLILLNSAAYFLEMGSNNIANSSVKLNLIDQTEKSLEGINFWTWSDLLVALKQCQEIFPATNNSSILGEKLLNSIIGKLAVSSIPSPFRFSSENFSSQFSSETSSISISTTTRNNYYYSTWWFQELLFLNLNFFEKSIRMMISHKLNHVTIFKFIIFYMKFKLPSFRLDEKCQVIEAVISLVLLLDKTCLSWKGLFEVFRVSSSLKTIRKWYIFRLLRLMGSQLDQATLDHLLIRSPDRKKHKYDLNLVLRIVKAYIVQDWISPSGLNKVVCLFDFYLLEIAPDVHLKPAAFAKLLSVIPDSARKTCDRKSQAIDLYLEVHDELTQEEIFNLYSAMDYAKLSAENLQFLGENYRSLKLKLFNDKLKKSSRKESERVLEKNLHLKVAELEKFCKPHVPIVIEQRLCNSSKVKYLPKLCS